MAAIICCKQFTYEIVFKQWVNTDRTTLVTQQCSIEDFIETLVKMIDSFTVHHFVSKHQSSHLSTVKDQLIPGTCIIILDFAENYSFCSTGRRAGISLGQLPGNIASILGILQRQWRHTSQSEFVWSVITWNCHSLCISFSCFEVLEFCYTWLTES